MRCIFVGELHAASNSTFRIAISGIVSARGGLFGGHARVVGRLAAIVSVAGRSFDDAEPSWTVSGASWGRVASLRGA
eukprot:9502020-Pyramimonas_sp.AAC.1